MSPAVPMPQFREYVSGLLLFRRLPIFYVSPPCHLAKGRDDQFPSVNERNSFFFFQSVFKNYDLDQDGYISQEEFEKIAASFPFSFCVMDKDR